jgi:putative GTP pyrophosphokinase
LPAGPHRAGLRLPSSRMAEGEIRTPQEWGDAYARERHRHIEFTEEIERLMDRVLAESEIRQYQVESRPKEVESFVEKIERKNEKYANPLSDVTDLCGVRVILNYPGDVERVGELIERQFDVDWENSQRVRGTDPERFGYRSDHYIVKIDAERAKLPEWGVHRDLVAEIQVRTVMQHAWAAVDHEVRYKGEDLPPDLRHRLSRLAAQLELADEEFARVQEENEELKASYAASIEGGERDLELDTLSLAGYLQVTDAHWRWAGTAESVGFRRMRRDEPEFDRGAYTVRADLGFLLTALVAADVRDLDGVDRLLGSAETWGAPVLSEVAARSSARGFDPVAVPQDVLAILASYATADPSLVDHVEWVPELREAVREVVAAQASS